MQVSPGIGIARFSNNYVAADISNEAQTSDFQFSIGAGLGLDIGLTDLITITPMINARYFPGVIWDNTFPGIVPDTEIVNPNPESDLLQFSGGIRIGFRLDDW